MAALGKSLLFACFVLACVCAFCQPAGYASNRLIIKIKQPLSKSASRSFTPKSLGIPALDRLNKKYSVTDIHRIGRNTGIYVLTFSTDQNIPALVIEYFKTGNLYYAEPDYIGRGGGDKSVLPNDQYFNRQWALHNDGSFSFSRSVAGADIKMTDGWAIAQGNDSVLVGIIDTGIKKDFTEFSGRIWTNNDEIPGNKMDDDSNGYVDDVYGYDFAYSDNNITDFYGHGTNVAGILGANGNNGTGYAGVDWHCKIMMCKGLDNSNSGYYSWWAEAMYYEIEKGVNIINMSLEGTAFSQALQDAADSAYAKNILVVACMGNYNSSAPSYPGALKHVMAVGSTSADDSRTSPFPWSSSSGSDYGPDISVVAPGNYIYSVSNAGNNYFDQYWSGTSQATPHVAGLAALLLGQDRSRNADTLRKIIEMTADDRVGDPVEDTKGWDKYYGYGRINAYRALKYRDSIRDTSTRDTTVVTGKTSTLHQNICINTYPNPFQNDATITIGLKHKENVHLKLQNANGKLLANIQLPMYDGSQLKLSELTNTIDLPSGMYFLQAAGGDVVQTVKLIKVF